MGCGNLQAGILRRTGTAEIDGLAAPGAGNGPGQAFLDLFDNHAACGATRKAAAELAFAAGALDQVSDFKIKPMGQRCGHWIYHFLD